MKSKPSTHIVESKTEREPPNAYEVLMPRPRTSTSPKKHESPRPPPEDNIQKKIAKENRAANKKNLEVMSKNKTNSKHSAVDNMVKMPKIVFLPSDSEEEQIDLKSMIMEKPIKKASNLARRKIMSDSESDAHDSPKKNCTKADSPLKLQQSRLNFKPQSNASKEEVNTNKRNSLLNYFNSVSREEAKKTAEQIKVKVHIHSPPTTPGRKPINKKLSPVESPRRSARMRLSYEMCDQIEMISSEIISAPNTHVKISTTKIEVLKVETPKRSTIRTPRKSPLKIKEKPEYVKNLKLKIKAPVKLIATTDAPAEKFILSPEALDELFLSPNPNKKGDKGLKKQKKKKKVNLVVCNDAVASKSAEKIIKTPKLTPKKTYTTSLKATPKKVIITPKNSPRTKIAISSLKSKSSSKSTGKTPSKRERSSGSCSASSKSADATDAEASRSSRKKIHTPNKHPEKTNTSDSIVVTKEEIIVTPSKSLPRTKTAASASKSVSSASKAIGKKTPSKCEKSSGLENSLLKTSGKAAPKRERSSGSDASATNKSVAKTESPARPPRNSTFSAKSPQVIKEIPLVKIATPSKSTKSPKSISRKNNKALSAKKSAFEEIMSKKKSLVSTSKVKDVSSNFVLKIRNSKKSLSTLAKKESLKSNRSKVSSSTTSKVSETPWESSIQLPSKEIRKSLRIPLSESRKARYEEIEEPLKQRPKKRKRKIESDDSEDDDDVIMIESKSKKSNSQSAKPPLKLAPMFMKRSSSKISEKIENPAITEAKRRFLSSGVPDCIKKIAEIHSLPDQAVLIFPTTAHVKQEDEFPAWTLSEKHLELLPNDYASFEVKIPPLGPGTLMDQKSPAVSELREPNLPHRIETYRKVLNNLKLENPNYCVIRNYKRLKSKCVKSLPQPVAEKIIEVQAKRQKRVRKRKRSEVEVIEEPIIAQEPSLVWTEKYKPMSSEDVVGNITEVNQLKTWLESWKRFHKSDDPNYDIIKRKRSKSGSSDEFIENDESGEEDNSQMPINTSLIFGPCGSGKTSTVYAIAHELGYKVLEINASSKRTGKHLLKLQEATQSHRVCAKNEAAESIAKMFAQPTKQKKKKNTAKVLPRPVEVDEASNKMSLILIENADIIFEDEDEGFVAALVTLVQSSKRPVVMVANDSLCPHLSRFLEQSLVIEMDWPYPGHLCAWLQLVSLVEGVRISADAAQRLLGRFNGDVARCLNQLQFWTMTGGNNLENCSEALMSSLKDEDSSDSMITEKVEEGTPLHDRCIELFLGNTSCGLIPYPISLSEVWWNLAPILSLPEPKSRRIAVEPYVKPRNPTERLNELFSEMDGAVEEENIFDRLKRKNRTMDTDVIHEEEIIKPLKKKIVVVVEKWVSVCSQGEIDSLAMLLDNLAAADEMTSNPKMNGGTYDVGPCARVWDRKPTDGISGRLDFSLCWHREQAVAQSMAHFLVDRSVSICRDKLGATGGEYNVSLPKQEDIRWRMEQQEADNTIVSLVPMNVLIDHRATFVDYLPMLQSVCRHENARLSTNTKRRNRFFHYLRGLGCHPSEEAVNVLCSTFDAGLWRCDDRAESDTS